MDDSCYMSQALALAERGRGRTSPNPMVGAIVVNAEGVVVGRGAHEFAGGPHAEVHALAEAGEQARGATLYCTLEPCSHTGRTGPCAPLVVAAGIRRAVVAAGDPNPLVRGRGFAHLRRHGVDLEVGVLEREAASLNAPFFSVMRWRRPFVTMKVALSRDGRVAAGIGLRTRLTGAAADRYIHRERAEVDALAIGAGTVLADDPLLTPRGAYRSRPLVRVLWDRSLRTPPRARLLSTLGVGPVIIVTRPPRSEDDCARARALRAAGATVEAVEAGEGGFVAAALERLAALGISSLTVEGGPVLHEAIWRAGLVDRVQVFRTPVVLGPSGVPWLNEVVFPPDVLGGARTVSLGDDVMIEGYVHRTR